MPAARKTRSSELPVLPVPVDRIRTRDSLLTKAAGKYLLTAKPGSLRHHEMHRGTALFIGLIAPEAKQLPAKDQERSLLRSGSAAWNLRVIST